MSEKVGVVYTCTEHSYGVHVLGSRHRPVSGEKMEDGSRQGKAMKQIICRQGSIALLTTAQPRPTHPVLGTRAAHNHGVLVV